MTDGWIVIPNWDTFQHYRDRDPVWIKLYLQLRSRDEWRQLTLAARGLLVCIWIEYAAGHTQLRTSDLPSRIGQKVHRRTFDSLLQAGLVEVSASRPLAPRYQHASPEKRREDPSNLPVNGEARTKISNKELRRYTGCRATRGSHSFGYVQDPLGTDKPPPDWPYGKPSRHDVELALEIADR